MKRILALVLTLMMVLSLVACGGKDDPAPSGGTPDAGQQEESTDAPEESGPADDGDSADHDSQASAEWWTKPFHLKGVYFNFAEQADVELELLYDGEELLIWRGEEGHHAYEKDGAIWADWLDKAGGINSSTETRDDDMFLYMEYTADTLGGMIGYLQNIAEYPDNWIELGSETVGGFDCNTLQNKNAMGTITTLWIDKDTGIIIQEEIQQTLTADGKEEEPTRNYLFESVVTENVPAVADVYQPQ